MNKHLLGPRWIIFPLVLVLFLMLALSACSTAASPTPIITSPPATVPPTTIASPVTTAPATTPPATTPPTTAAPTTPAASPSVVTSPPPSASPYPTASPAASPSASTSAAATASPAATATTSAYTVNTMTSPSLGTYLVNSDGMTLYYYKDDSSGVSNVPANILPNWPPFYSSQITIPSSLNAADFNSFTRTDGTMQTTYKGWPLYTFIKDTAPGQTNGQGLLGLWYVVNSASIQPAPSASPSATVATPTATTSP